MEEKEGRKLVCRIWSTFAHHTVLHHVYAGCVIEEKIDYNAHDIKMIKKVENQEACAKLAAANEKAKFWTYQAASKNCFIKTSKKGKRPNKTVVSGNQECGV